MNLKCVRDYRNDPTGHVYQAGDTLTVDERVAEWLMRDSPGTFVEHTTKALDGPPSHKAILSPPASKSDRADDLTVIAGISDNRQRWLNEHGIYTYADLAAADVDLLSELRGVGQTVAENWKAEAGQLG